MRYTVIVKNIGTVHDGPDIIVAEQVFKDYATLSQLQYGRAAGEDVTLYKDDNPSIEYFGSLHNK